MLIAVVTAAAAAPTTSISLTEDFPARRKLRDDVDHVLGGHDLIQLDDVRVVEKLHDLDLAVDLVEVGLVQLALVDDLDGHLEWGEEKISTQWHYTSETLENCNGFPR